MTTMTAAAAAVVVAAAGSQQRWQGTKMDDTMGTTARWGERESGKQQSADGRGVVMAAVTAMTREGNGGDDGDGYGRW